MFLNLCADAWVCSIYSQFILNNIFISRVGSMTKYLFVVCQHGSHGKVADLAILKNCIRERVGALQTAGSAIDLTVWDTSVNSGLKSDKGTAKCGVAMYNALQPVLHEWITTKRALIASQGGSMHFSCVGHSFGGILLRELVHTLCNDPVVLDALDVKKDLEFESFVTVATPHCGIAMLSWGLAYGAYAIGMVYSQTYLDLAMGSDMLWSTMLTAPYLDALKRFKRRVSFANLHKDPLVPFVTAAMCFDAEQKKGIEAAFKERPGERMLDGLFWSLPAAPEAPPIPPSRFASAMAWAEHSALVLQRCGWEIAPIRYDGIAPLAHNSIIRTIPGCEVMLDVVYTIASCVIPRDWSALAPPQQ